MVPLENTDSEHILAFRVIMTCRFFKPLAGLFFVLSDIRFGIENQPQHVLAFCMVQISRLAEKFDSIRDVFFMVVITEKK